MSRIKLPLDRQREVQKAIREANELLDDLQKLKESGVDIDWREKQIRDEVRKLQAVHRHFCPDCQAGET